MSDEKLLEGIGDYQYGFSDPEQYVFKSEKGLNEEIVRRISALKGEPEWMLQFRLKALDHFQKRPMPNWGPDLSGLNLDDIYYYLKPTDTEGRSWDDVPEAIKTLLTNWVYLKLKENSWPGWVLSTKVRWFITRSRKTFLSKA